MTNVLLLSPYADTLLPTFKRAGDTVTTLRDPTELEWHPPAEERHEWIVMYGWPKILMDDWYWRNFPGRIINLHISLLPWNRGADPNFWSWREGTPKGVTIHQVDTGVDTGRVLFTARVGLFPYEHTLASSHKVLSALIEGLFAAHWIEIRDGEIAPRVQHLDGSYHQKSDLDPFRWALDDWSLPCSAVVGLKPRP